MKKVKVNLEDVLVVLMAMQDNGTQDVVFFEHGGHPAMADADDPDSIITFQTFDEEMENPDGDAVH